LQDYRIIRDDVDDIAAATPRKRFTPSSLPFFSATLEGAIGGTFPLPPNLPHTPARYSFSVFCSFVSVGVKIASESSDSTAFRAAPELTWA
jgi:hypothetical protein